MHNTKKILKEFMENKGASAEEIAEFERMYDKDVQGAMKAEAQQSNQEADEASRKMRSDMAQLAEQSNITK